MKETVKTSRTAGYLEKMFRKLNEHYFASAIEEPIITIQSTPRAYGYVTISKAWRKSNGDRRHELNLNAGTLDRPIEEVVAKKLAAMDLTASIMCMEQKMPMLVFGLDEKDSIVNTVHGKFSGTKVTV